MAPDVCRHWLDDLHLDLTRRRDKQPLSRGSAKGKANRVLSEAFVALRRVFGTKLVSEVS